MSNLELEALTSVTRKMLEKEWKIKPRREYAHCFETSLNAPGWSISLLNVSGIERETKKSVSTLLELLDSENDAPGWPKSGYKAHADAPEEQIERATTSSTDHSRRGPKMDSSLLESALRSGCNAAIEREPDITKWDIVMGDGDCGEAVVGMCQVCVVLYAKEKNNHADIDLQAVLRTLNDKELMNQGHLFHILDEISEAIEAIGGTLGAIISIIVASFTTHLREAYSQEPETFSLNASTAGVASGGALRNLMSYTPAQKGGRTVMDTLIPFCETLESTSDIAKAVKAAEQGAHSTSGMKAKFGRATYVGESAVSQDDDNDAPPDPGAMAAAFFLRGLLDGMN